MPKNSPCKKTNKQTKKTISTAKRKTSAHIYNNNYKQYFTHFMFGSNTNKPNQNLIKKKSKSIVWLVHTVFDQNMG